MGQQGPQRTGKGIYIALLFPSVPAWLVLLLIQSNPARKPGIHEASTERTPLPDTYQQRLSSLLMRLFVTIRVHVIFTVLGARMTSRMHLGVPQLEKDDRVLPFNGNLQSGSYIHPNLIAEDELDEPQLPRKRFESQLVHPTDLGAWAAKEGE
jgi:hypothetical protein